MDYQELLNNYLIIDDDRKSIVRVNRSTFILIKSLNITDKALEKLNNDVKSQLENGINNIENILRERSKFCVKSPNVTKVTAPNNYPISLQKI